MAKNSAQKAVDLKLWNITVSNMGSNINKAHYTYKNPNNSYYRFTDTVKGWMQSLFGMKQGVENNLVWCDHSELSQEERELSGLMKVNMTQMPLKWWDIALSGKNLDALPKFSDAASEEEINAIKEGVYDAVLPAYRAVKESFAKRSWIQWFTNHRQYTAERDTLKVLKNMILSMTGDSLEQLNEQYDAFKAQVPTDNVADAERLEGERKQATKNLEEQARQGKEDALKEKALEDYERVQQEIKEDVIQEIGGKTSDELTMGDQYTICTNDAGFQKNVINAISEVINALPDKKLASVRKLMTKSHVYTPLVSEAEKLCNEYDLADNDGASKEELEKVVKSGVAKMFKVALNATKNLKITDANERIIVAQKLTDIMLNSATPVSFNQKAYGAYGKGFTVLRNDGVIRSEISDEAAIANAKETFGALYPENKVQEIEQISVNLNEVPAQVGAPVEQNSTEIKAPKIEK